jgi:hypothetical protein
VTAWTWAIVVGALFGVGGLIALVRLALTTTRNPRHRR